MFRTTFLISALAPFLLYSQETPTSELKGMPPRTSPSEYQTQAKVGTIIIAAEFTGHAVPTADGDPLSTDDYIVVEVAFFGPPEARLKLSLEDFSLRINAKKAPLPTESSELVL